jgi:dTDP-4-dehydrorhamnose 3,5-epimerase-like enzyme
MVAECGRHVPFVIKRIFAIYDVPPGQARGGHAHREQHQFIIMMTGACRLTIDDGASQSEDDLTGPKAGLHIPPRVWIELKAFTPGSVCLVLASDLYDPDDYVRDYAEFKRLIASR